MNNIKTDFWKIYVSIYKYIYKEGGRKSKDEKNVTNITKNQKKEITKTDLTVYGALLFSASRG